MRKRPVLTTLRKGFSLEVKVNQTVVVLTVNEFANGLPCELFIRLTQKQYGSDLHILLDCFAKSVSLNLQNGVPLVKLISLYKGVEFNPKGAVTGLAKPMQAQSIIDFIFSFLEDHYISKELATAA